MGVPLSTGKEGIPTTTAPQEADDVNVVPEAAKATKKVEDEGEAARIEEEEALRVQNEEAAREQEAAEAACIEEEESLMVQNEEEEAARIEAEVAAQEAAEVEAREQEAAEAREHEAAAAESTTIAPTESATENATETSIEAEAKRKAEEEERKRIEAEAKAKAEAEAKRKAEEEERQRIEAEAKSEAKAEAKSTAVAAEPTIEAKQNDVAEHVNLETVKEDDDDDDDAKTPTVTFDVTFKAPTKAKKKKEDQVSTRRLRSNTTAATPAAATVAKASTETKRSKKRSSSTQNTKPQHQPQSSKTTIWRNLKIGSRVEIYWKEDKRYYPCTIEKCDATSTNSICYVRYDDGDSECTDMASEKLRWYKENNTTATPKPSSYVRPLKKPKNGDLQKASKSSKRKMFKLPTGNVGNTQISSSRVPHHVLIPPKDSTGIDLDDKQAEDDMSHFPDEDLLENEEDEAGIETLPKGVEENIPNPNPMHVDTAAAAAAVEGEGKLPAIIPPPAEEREGKLPHTITTRVETAAAAADGEEKAKIVSLNKKKKANRRQVHSRPKTLNQIKDEVASRQSEVALKCVNKLQYCTTWEHDQERNVQPKSQHIMLTYDEMVPKPTEATYSRYTRLEGHVFYFCVPEDFDTGNNLVNFGTKLASIGQEMASGVKEGTNWKYTHNTKEYHELVFGLRGKQQTDDKSNICDNMCNI